MAQILLTQGQVALVDDADYQWLTDMGKWHAYENRDSGKFYVRRNIARLPGQNQRTIHMHRIILGVTDPKIQVDHKNLDPRDNRRSNLRFATRSQNNINQGLRKDNTSGYKGVFAGYKQRTWWATLMVGTKRMNLGNYSCRIEAAKVYDAAAFLHFGEFAFLNFPKEISEPIQQ